MKERNGTLIGRRFHVGARQLGGPVGLGVRIFFWRILPDGWMLNLDILLGPWDVQVGIHQD